MHIQKTRAWSRLLGLALPAALALAACDGRISAPGGDDGDGVGDGALAETPRVARLTHQQWENTVSDLFRLSEPLGLGERFQADPPLGRFDNNIARLVVTAGHWQDYQRAAESVAELAVGDPEILGSILPAELPDDDAEAARAFIESFGLRAFRRPLTSTEIDRFTALFDEAPSHYTELDGFTAGVRLVVESMMQSPHFLYRLETAAEESGGAIALTGYEVASRLSYALWNTMPDDELYAAAASGELDSEAGVLAQAERLFADPRTRDQFAHFHFQAFKLREYTDLDKDTDVFPQWRSELGVMMQDEMTRFLGSVAFEGGGVRDFLTSTRSYVNADLAAIYGIEGEFGDELEEVELDPSQRAGFLTRAGFLARNATLAQADPIHRGVFVNLNLLCREIAAVPNLPENLVPVGDTNRERIDSITGVGTCGESCHANIINPIGFALENYDAIGQYRTQDNGFEVDAAASYVFEDGRRIDFQNGVELSQALADSPEVHACYVQQMLEYVYGRDLTERDAPLVSELAADSFENDLTVRALVGRVVTSRAFRFRAPE